VTVDSNPSEVCAGILSDELGLELSLVGLRE
jgi:hypothetical protein